MKTPRISRNPNGTWSDAANKRGYFTRSADLKEPIRHSY